MKINQTLVDKIVKNLQEYAKENGMKKAILGISGGKDSTVAAMLLVKALDKENVIGVLMPNGVQKDLKDSLTVVNTLDILNYTVNISNQFASTVLSINEQLLNNGNELPEESIVNIAPRLRMTVLYTLGKH